VESAEAEAGVAAVGAGVAAMGIRDLKALITTNGGTLVGMGFIHSLTSKLNFMTFGTYRSREN